MAAFKVMVSSGVPLRVLHLVFSGTAEPESGNLPTCSLSWVPRIKAISGNLLAEEVPPLTGRLLDSVEVYGPRL